MVKPPTRDEAVQFVAMMASGMPALQAIMYFIPSDIAADTHYAKAMVSVWIRSEDAEEAQKALMGGSWVDFTADEKIRYALEKHYVEAAYFLYTNNYSDLGPADTNKANMCREILEKRLAISEGSQDALSRFYAEVAKAKTSYSSPIVPTIGIGAA